MFWLYTSGRRASEMGILILGRIEAYMMLSSW